MFFTSEWNSFQQNGHVFHILLWVSKRFSSIFGGSSQLFFDTQDLIVFGKTFRSARCSSFYLTGRKADHKICDKSIFSFTGPATGKKLCLLTTNISKYRYLTNTLIKNVCELFDMPTLNVCTLTFQTKLKVIKKWR